MIKLKIACLTLLFLTSATFASVKSDKNPCAPGWVYVDGQCYQKCESTRTCNYRQICVPTSEGNVCKH